MKTLKLGTSGEDVSALCLGAMYFGSRNDKDTSYAMLEQYIDAGGSFIDTANIYAHWAEGSKGGESETLLGEWMRERGNRSELFIASKVGFGYSDVPSGLSAQCIIEECEKSLKRLKTDTIDLYYAHVDDTETDLDVTLGAFDQLVRDGKVRYIGASNYSAWRLVEALWVSEINDWATFCCIQQRYSYLRPKHGANFGAQRAVNDDLVDCCRENGIPILAYSALLNGAYTRDDRDFPEQYHGPDSDARMTVLRAVAEETGATLNQVVLAWMLHSDPAAIPLIAASTKEQMQENLGALDVKLSAEQMQRLNDAKA
jgi:aryl-alcohol dehydrogenase-like predicted oxidoreductase